MATEFSCIVSIHKKTCFKMVSSNKSNIKTDYYKMGK